MVADNLQTHTNCADCQTLESLNPIPFCHTWVYTVRSRIILGLTDSWFLWRFGGFCSGWQKKIKKMMVGTVAGRQIPGVASVGGVLQPAVSRNRAASSLLALAAARRENFALSVGRPSSSCSGDFRVPVSWV
jgi:hypothetical protein